MTDKEIGKNQDPIDIDLNENDVDRFMQAFIEMELGPEHAGKKGDELTEEQIFRILHLIAKIPGDFYG